MLEKLESKNLLIQNFQYCSHQYCVSNQVRIKNLEKNSMLAQFGKFLRRLQRLYSSMRLNERCVYSRIGPSRYFISKLFEMYDDDDEHGTLSALCCCMEHSADIRSWSIAVCARWVLT